MKLTIARHGETNYNVLVLHNADPSVNVHLTEKDIQEAKTLGATLQHKNFESSEDVFRRTADFLNFLRQQPYQNVLIVASKRNFRHLRSLLDHLDPRASLHEHIPNGELLVREL